MSRINLTVLLDVRPGALKFLGVGVEANLFEVFMGGWQIKVGDSLEFFRLNRQCACWLVCLKGEPGFDPVRMGLE